MQHTIRSFHTITQNMLCEKIYVILMTNSSVQKVEPQSPDHAGVLHEEGTIQPYSGFLDAMKHQTGL